MGTATFLGWRSKIAEASAAAVTQRRELEMENGTLRRLYADLALENAALKDVLAQILQGQLRNGRCWRYSCGNIICR